MFSEQFCQKCLNIKQQGLIQQNPKNILNLRTTFEP